MANHLGSEGTIKVGAAPGVTVVAELNDWAFSESTNIIDDSNLADMAQTVKAGRTSATGSLSCFLDETDTLGQGVLTIAATAVLNLLYEGAVAADKYWTGSVVINGIERGASNDGMVTFNVSWTANGGMSEATVV